MINFKLITIILIILFQSGNVLSDSNIFNVNNIVINKELSKNTEKLVNKAFVKAFQQLIERLLLEEDIKKLSNIELNEIKNLISYYQIENTNEIIEEKENIKVNIFFDKNSMHNFFYDRNILYSEISNTEIIFFPLLQENKNFFIYSQNFFYKNWNNENNNNLIEYTLPLESIENIQKINSKKDNIYELNINEFFKEYSKNNIVFANIEISDNTAKIFLKSRIEGKKINKTIYIEKKDISNKEEFYKKIIFKINFLIQDLLKSQNLIDVRTPSFLNAEVQLNKKNNLIEFRNRIKKIDLIDNFYVQKLNKDNIIIKIKYLGKIDQIINKLKGQNINLVIKEGQWKVEII